MQVRAWHAAAAGGVIVLVASAVLVGGAQVRSAASPDSSSTATAVHEAARAGTQASTSPTPTVEPSTTPEVPSAERTLKVTKRLVGPFSPKSVVATGNGLVIAANMMYRHTITVFSSHGSVVTTIPDAVDLRAFGQSSAPAGKVRGAPVETAISPDGRHAWVSNYAMYGKGFSSEGKDDCPGRNSLSRSYVYRVNLASKKIDGVVQVGKTPKYLATTPDGTKLLVANWCSYDLSVVDVASMKQVASVHLGPHPRGIAVTKDSRIAYVAVMGAAGIAKVNLQNLHVSWIREVGAAPRHVVLSPDESRLYASVNGTGQVVAINTATKKVVRKVRTGQQPRSLAISPDGTALYVVNYASGTMSKVRASDMSVIQTVKTAVHPIGITYDPTTDSVWVSCYRGVVYVMADRA